MIQIACQFTLKLILHPLSVVNNMRQEACEVSRLCGQSYLLKVVLDGGIHGCKTRARLKVFAGRS